MDKRKGIILAIVLFLIIGLGTFVFAGSSDEESGNGTTTPQNGETDSKDPSDSDNQTDGNTTTEGGTEDGNNTTTRPVGGNGNGGQTPAEGEGNGQTPAPTVDYKALLEELASMVKDAANKEDLTTAEQFRVDNNITEENIAALGDATASETYEDIIAILTDNDSPVVTPADLNGAYFNSTVKVNVTDDTPVTYKLLLNGEEVTDADLENLTAEGTYELTVTDSAFNSTTVTFTVDTTDPALLVNDAEVENGETIYVNEDAKITVDETNLESFTSNGNDRTENVLNGSWTAGNDGAYNIVVTDKAGNETTYTIIVDKTAPEVGSTDDRITDGTYHPGSVPVRVSDANLDSITVNGEEVEFEGTVWEQKFTANGTYEIVATDKAGNSETFTFTVDKKAPVISNVPADGAVVNHSVSPKVSDTNLDTVTLTKNGEEVVGYQEAGMYELSHDGIYTLTVTDKAGNEVSTTFEIDKTGPEVTFPSTHGSSQGYKSWETLSITITEPNGLTEVYYAWSNTNKYVNATNSVPTDNIVDNGDGTYTINVPTIDGRNRLSVKAVDSLGNTTETYSKSGAYNIDTTSAKVKVNYSETNPTKGPITVTLTSNEIITIADTSWTKVSDTEYTKVYSVDTTETVEVVDRAGNVTTVNVSFSNIDNEIPVVTFANTHGQKYYDYEYITVNIADESGLAEVYYTWGKSNKYTNATNKVADDLITVNVDGTYTVKIPTIDGRYKLSIKAIDTVGNVYTGYSSSGWYNIDKTNPEVTLYKWSSDGNHQEVVAGSHNYCVVATATDNIGLSKFTLNGETYTDNQVICDDGEYTLVATDKAGNTDEITFTVDRTYGAVTINNEDIYNAHDLNTMNYYSNISSVTFSKDGTVRLTKDNVGVYYGPSADFKYDFTDGVYKFEFFDNSGNPTAFIFEVDSVAPKFDNLIDKTEDFSVSLGVTDDSFAYIELINKETGETIKEERSWVSFSKEGTWTAQVFDKTGNASAIYTFTIKPLVASAEIDGVKVNFSTYAELFTAIPDNTLTSVKVEKDITEDIVIPENKVVNIDLSNKTISGNKVITNNGTINSISNGTIKSTNNGIINNGTINTIDSLTIDAARTGINNQNGKIGEIKNSTIEAVYYPVYLSDNATIDKFENNNITGHYMTAIYVADSSNVKNIVSGFYTSDGMQLDNTQVAGFGLYISTNAVVENISGGTFKGSKAAVANYGTINSITGGIFEKKYEGNAWDLSKTFLYNGTVKDITGGSFYSSDGTPSSIFWGKYTLNEEYQFVQDGEYLKAVPNQ